MHQPRDAMTEPITLMPDWEAFPVWGLDSRDRLSESLRGDLIAWRERWEDLAEEGEVSLGLGDDDDWLQWPPWAEMVAEGLRLRARLAVELGMDESQIRYETFS
jgi:hypothetical protein